MAIKYKYNKDGRLEAFENGKSLGFIDSTGDDIPQEDKQSKKIRKLLAMYGASKEEIENFMYDLAHMDEAPSDSFDEDRPDDIID